ncbi:restriction endonuclease subunit S [Bacteroides caccae]|uniref:restriction endonuclease subunit S n=2 Tax=Bacteroides caccae TaxID=47678 RepID=UPI0020283BC7|nr:restriction endonuclease subunit S [Bacteroides caccae]
MDTKKLRQKILNLAIHGKLVPQDPNDEPASVLLERIKAEKERLIKEGKIKRSKKPVKTSDTPHYQQDVPFEVPKSWVWCKLDDIVSFQGGYAYKSNTYVNQSDWQVIRIGNVKNDNLILDTQPVFVEDVIGKTTEKYLLKKDDILFTMTGTKGKRDYFYTAKVPLINKKLLLNQRVGCLRCFSSEINIDFLCLVLKGEYVLNAIFSTETGNVSQGNIGSESTLDLNIAIPPLTEQHRIVTEIKRWFALIDQVEQDKVDLQTTIKQTKSKILDLAIHGKLVPQDPNDKPAIELLKRINPDFTPCDNGHSEKLPQNWTWVKGKNIFAPMKSTKPKNEEFQYIDIDSIDNRRQIISEIKTIKTENAPSRASRYTQKNDVIFSMVRPYLRNIAKVANDNCIASTGFYVCSPIPQLLNSDYCYYLMISDNVVNGLNQFMKGDNSPSINKGHIDEWLFPLPPLAEQQRIVQKIEELFSALDNIQTALEV